MTGVPSSRHHEFPSHGLIPMTDWLPLARNACALLTTFGACAASGALNGPTFPRRTAAFSVAALTVFTPFLAVPSASGVRFLCASGTALALFRNLDLVRDAARYTPTERAIHVSLPLDTRRVTRAPRRIDASACLRALAFALPTALAVAFVVHLHATTLADWIARWFAATVAAYCSIEVVMATLHAAAAALGFTLPKLHDHPILARSLSEFWGRRWNLSVRDMLHEHCFRPLRRHASLGAAVFGTFAGSALLHAWLFFPAGGFALASSSASFFLLQGALVLVEQRARVRHWPAMLQRAWTVLAVILPLPLLLEPLLALTLP